MNVNKTVADLYLYKIRRYIESYYYKSAHSDIVTKEGRSFSIRGLSQYLRMTTIIQPDEIPFLLNLVKTLKELHPIVKPVDGFIDQYFWWTIRNRNQSTRKEETKAHPTI